MKKLDKRKKILVVGLGRRTGLAACNFLAERGYSVAASDIKSRGDLGDIIAKLNRKVELHAGSQGPDLLKMGYNVIILSPGVPAAIPLIKEAIRKRIPVISEIELSYMFMKGRIIGITGTDGKSTTTSLTGHILSHIGVKTFTGGNIGIPLISLVDGTDDRSVSVVELSSFQLETIDDFRPDVSAILNVTPDHLDRYAGMKEYFGAKLRVAENQKNNDFFIYYKDDAIIRKGLRRIKSKKLSFSMNDRKACAFFGDGYVFIRDGRRTIRCVDSSRLKIIGMHNILNVMASILMVQSILRRMRITPDYERIAGSCYKFIGLPHRMEKIGNFGGRDFINDSKATTVGAVEMALAGLEGGIVLILGGRTKGDDYSRLEGSVKGKVKALVLIGESRDSFAAIFKDIKTIKAGSMDDAVLKSMKASAEGDTILLSPACASFDMYRNYEERGRSFKESFKRLKKGELDWI
jgi:UDP-N-acetylmuramoylalanine--D-glutamate ligase